MPADVCYADVVSEPLQTDRKEQALQTFTLALVILFAAQAPPAPATQAPDVTGEWTGTWSSYNPAQPGVAPKEQCKSLTAKVTKKADGYDATFEGDCGRPYKYAITMDGRAAGKTVLFKGTADLGPKDGGVYDWIGRATEKEFVGFYTNAYYTGVFTLTRTK
jgi:hypothetical protein